MKRDNPDREDEFSEVVQLLRLKRYEQPDAGFDARNAAAIRTRIAALPGRTSWADRLWNLFGTAPTPAFRYALATVVVLGVSISALTYRQFPGASPLAAVTNDAPVLAQTAVSSPVVAQTNEAPELYRKPVFVFEAPSNRAPLRGTQYGPGPTQPVRFNY